MKKNINGLPIWVFQLLIGVSLIGFCLSVLLFGDTIKDQAVDEAIQEYAEIEPREHREVNGNMEDYIACFHECKSNRWTEQMEMTCVNGCVTVSEECSADSLSIERNENDG